MSPNPTPFVDRPTARIIALVSGGYCLLLVIGLLSWSLPHAYPGWFESPDFVEMRAAVEADPGNAEAVAAFRSEDRRRMQLYFLSRTRLRIGAGLLAAGVFVFILALRQYAALGRGHPVPRRRVEDETEAQARRVLWSVPLGGALSAAAVASVIWVFSPPAAAPVVPPDAGPDRGASETAEAAVPAHLQWPLFRGPSNMGIVPAGAYPTAWDAAAGTGILWTQAIPLPGRSSPVLWGTRLFVTGADSRARKVFCYERTTGRLLWETAVSAGARFASEAAAFETSDVNAGPAAPTPVTDGVRVYALFGTGELAALDMMGKQVWSCWLGLPESSYGFAASPTLYASQLFVQFDQAGAEDGRSDLIAFDTATGKELWRVPRPVGNSWSSPVIARFGEAAQLLTTSVPWAIAYDPAEGKELWRANLFFGDVAALPVADAERVYVSGHEAEVFAIRMGGQGEVTGTHVAWKNDEASPGTASPIVRDGLYMHATETGSVLCLDAKTGAKIWEQTLAQDAFYASLTLAGTSVYATDRQGVTHVFAFGRAYEALGQGTVGEVVEATPAFVENRIYMRGEKQLFCIGTAAP